MGWVAEYPEGVAIGRILDRKFFTENVILHQRDIKRTKVTSAVTRQLRLLPSYQGAKSMPLIGHNLKDQTRII